MWSFQQSVLIYVSPEFEYSRSVAAMGLRNTLLKPIKKNKPWEFDDGVLEKLNEIDNSGGSIVFVSNQCGENVKKIKANFAKLIKEKGNAETKTLKKPKKPTKARHNKFKKAAKAAKVMSPFDLKTPKVQTKPIIQKSKSSPASSTQSAISEALKPSCSSVLTEDALERHTTLTSMTGETIISSVPSATKSQKSSFKKVLYAPTVQSYKPSSRTPKDYTTRYSLKTEKIVRAKKPPKHPKRSLTPSIAMRMRIIELKKKKQKEQEQIRKSKFAEYAESLSSSANSKTRSSKFEEYSKRTPKRSMPSSTSSEIVRKRSSPFSDYAESMSTPKRTPKKSSSEIARKRSSPFSKYAESLSASSSASSSSASSLTLSLTSSQLIKTSETSEISLSKTYRRNKIIADIKKKRAREKTKQRMKQKSIPDNYSQYLDSPPPPPAPVVQEPPEHRVPPVIAVFAMEDNCFKKPFTNIWKVIIWLYRRKEKPLPSIHHSIYIGGLDGSYRPDTDRAFAYNIGLHFFSKIRYFTGENRKWKYSEKCGSTKYIKYKLENPETPPNILEELKKVPTANKYIIIIMGRPSSGKHTLLTDLLEQIHSIYGQDFPVGNISAKDHISKRFQRKKSFSYELKKLIENNVITIVVDDKPSYERRDDILKVASKAKASTLIVNLKTPRCIAFLFDMIKIQTSKNPKLKRLSDARMRFWEGIYENPDYAESNILTIDYPIVLKHKKELMYKY